MEQKYIPWNISKVKKEVFFESKNSRTTNRYF